MTKHEKDFWTIGEECDMLRGNIARMCVTDNMNELMSMRDYALRIIETIYDVNYNRLTEREDNKNNGKDN